MVRAVQETPVVEASAVLYARRDDTPRTRHAWEVRARLRPGRRRAWSLVDVGFVAALFTILVLNLLDITITLIHVGSAGWEAEGNYIIRRLGESGGATLPVLFKVVVIVGAMAVMWRIYRATQAAAATARTPGDRRRATTVLRTQAAATLALLLLYVGVIVNNALIVLGSG